MYLIYSAFAAPGSVRQSPIFPVLAVLIVAALSPVLVSHLHFLAPRRRWTIPAALVALAAVCLGGQLIPTRFDADTPQPDYIQYGIDADTGQATWLSAGSRPDDWTRQFFANGYATGRATFSPGYYLDQQHDVITAPAPQVELPAPTLTVLERGDGAITGTLVDYSNGLPSIPGRTVTPRPAGFIPAPFDFRDPTAVHRRVEVRPR